jgi:O-antigen/teichoic acid export membrane protein
MIRRLLENLLYSIGVQLFARISTVVLSLYVARQLGPDAYGLYSYVFSFVTIFSLLAEFGISTLLTRELAQEKEALPRLFVNALVLKLCLAVVMALVVGLAVWALGYAGLKRELIFLQLLATLVASMNSVLIAVIHAHQEMKYSSISTLIERLVLFGAGLGALLAFGSVRAYFWAALVAVLAQMAYLLRVTAKRYGLRVCWERLNGTEMVAFFKKSVPLGITAYVILFYYKADIVMLGLMKTEQDVSFYSAAYMLINFLGFVPSVMMSVMFPQLSHLYRHDRERFAAMLGHLMKLLVYAALPLAVLVAVLAPKIIGVFFGEAYGPSVPTLQILIWTVSLMFFNSFLGNLQVIEGRAVQNSLVVSATAAVNVLLNLVLIPRYSFTGSAVATLVSEMIPLLLIVGLRLFETRFALAVRDVGKALLAALVMGAALVWMEPLPLVVQAFLGVCAYGLALVACRAYGAEDWHILRSALRREENGREVAL